MGKVFKITIFFIAALYLCLVAYPRVIFADDTATQAQLDAAADIAADANIRVDITAVGTTFPGADASDRQFFRLFRPSGFWLRRQD